MGFWKRTSPVSLLLKEQLQKAGLTVWMTRDTDQDVSLEDRCAFANGLGADLFVSIHCNSCEGPSICGLESYWYSDARGRVLAGKVLQAVAARSIQTHGMREENYQVLRDTDMPSTLLEIGYMTCPEELRWLQTPDYQQRLAEAIAEGIVDMFSPSTA